MHGAAPAVQERALRMPGNAQSSHVLCPKNMLFLEIRLGLAHELCDPRNIVLGQVHETLLIAALRTPGLAFETNIQLFFW
jgi:hypothetical protein